MDWHRHISPTKITIPDRRADILSRPRLINDVKRFLTQKLTIIAAPAGYGKTTLLVDTAHQIDTPVCWFALDALDQNLHRFARHLVASIARQFSAFGQNAMALLQNGELPGGDADILLTTILSDIHRHIQTPFVLVLDDFHLVDPNDDVNDFVSRFVDEAPDVCHTVIATRKLLSLPTLPLMVARSQVGGLSFAELAFEPGELQLLVLKNFQRTISADEARQIAAATEGWITGLLLSSRLIGPDMVEQLRLARASGVGLYDYLASQILDEQPPDVRRFLLLTSVMDEFDLATCRELLSPLWPEQAGNWQSLIESVWRRNLFVLPVEDNGLWLRYHHLFKDFLQTTFKREAPAEYARLVGQLARTHQARQNWELAHALFLQIEDDPAIAQLIEEAGPTLLKEGQLSLLEQWITHLPVSIRQENPCVLSLAGITATMRGDPDAGLVSLTAAADRFSAAGQPAGLARALIWRAVSHRFKGSYQDALADADRALELTGAAIDLAPLHAEALRAKGDNLYRMGRLHQAIRWLSKSLQAYTRLEDHARAATVVMELGLATMYSANYPQARRYFNQALAFWQENHNPVQQATVLNNLGVLEHLSGNYQTALFFLEEAIATARQSGYARIEAFALAGIGDIYVDLQAHPAAETAYRQAADIAHRVEERFLQLYLYLALAALSRKQGQLLPAAQRLALAESLARQSKSHYEQSLFLQEAGQLALCRRDWPQATEYFRQAIDHLQGNGEYVSEILAHMRLAVACKAGNQPQDAASHLTSAIEHLPYVQNLHPLVAAIAFDAQIQSALRPLVKQMDPFSPAQTLLEQTHAFEEQIPRWRRTARAAVSIVPFVPPTLTIRALGEAQIIARSDAQNTVKQTWNYQASGELIFYLLAQGKSFTKEELGLIFWPDNNPAQLKENFKKTIYRIRRALGADVVVFDGEQYRFNTALDYSYDVEDFFAYLELARQHTTRPEQLANYQKAIDLYHGDYLPRLERKWALVERERIKQHYTQAALALAERYLEDKQAEQAQAIGQSLLAAQPELEAAHRLLMRVHAVMGNRAAIVRQFEKCTQIMQEEFGLSPSPQTVSLYQSLVF